MPRPPKGIYHDGDAILYAGYRKPADPAGLTWETVTDVAQRELLRTEELVNLRWDGAAVARRDQAEIAARLRDEQIAEDDRYFAAPRFKAAMVALVKTINLRLPADKTITRQQLVDAYKAELNR